MIFMLTFFMLVIVYLTYREYLYLSDWREVPPDLSIDSNSKLPLISVIIPVRNESINICKTLHSLIQQIYPVMEIFVIDDNSTDNTAEMVKGFIKKFNSKNITFISLKELPEGWVGKCNALWQGVQHAHGEWLLFCDADVILHPHAVISVYNYAKNHNEQFISLKFYKECHDFWEKTVVPYTYFVKGWLAPSPSKNVDMKIPKATATGDFILFKKDAYLMFGGHSHKKIKHHVVEDGSLARVAKQHGIRPVLLDGKHMISVRKFYNLKEIIIGFGKILSVEFQKGGIALYAVQFLLISIYSIVPLLLLIFMHVMDALSIIMIFVMVSITFSAYIYFLRQEKQPLWYLYLFPLGAVMLLGIGTFSMIQVKCKLGVNWRGRKYIQ